MKDRNITIKSDRNGIKRKRLKASGKTHTSIEKQQSKNGFRRHPAEKHLQ